MSKLHKVRPAVKTYSEYNVDRIWAQHAAVFIRMKDGDVRTFQPREAAVLLQNLNLSLPDEGSQRDEVVRFIDTVMAAIREALKQQETPDSAATAAVVAALKSGEEWAKGATADENAFISKVYQQLPMVEDDETRSAYRSLTQKGKSIQYIAGFLKAINAERVQEFNRTGKIAPLM